MELRLALLRPEDGACASWCTWLALVRPAGTPEDSSVRCAGGENDGTDACDGVRADRAFAFGVLVGRGPTLIAGPMGLMDS